MQIVEVLPGTGLVERMRALESAIADVDSPWQHPVTAIEVEARLRHGWDGEPARGWLGVVDGADVAGGYLLVSERDNLTSAGFSLGIHPLHRRRGHGTTMLRHLEALARSQGRPLVGTDGWDSPATAAFAAAHGYVPRSVGVIRRQELAAVPPGWREAAAEARRTSAADYEVLEWDEVAPAEHAEAVVAMWADINDAPHDDLESEDHVFTLERLQGYERAQRGAGRRLHHVVARHRGTGVLAGHTVALVEIDRPVVGHQHDTTVSRSHRGHRLGLVLKAVMMERLARLEPRLETVDTWNAESNDHMISVNESLGYRVLARSISYQRRLG